MRNPRPPVGPRRRRATSKMRSVSMKNRPLGHATRASVERRPQARPTPAGTRGGGAPRSYPHQPSPRASSLCATRRPRHGPPMATPAAAALSCSYRPSPSCSSAAPRRASVAPVNGAHSHRRRRRRLRLAPLHGEFGTLVRASFPDDACRNVCADDVVNRARSCRRLEGGAGGDERRRRSSRGEVSDG